MNRITPLLLALSLTAGCKTKDAAAKQEPPPPVPVEAKAPAEPAAPALVELDLSPGGDAWKGLTMKAPTGSQVKKITDAAVAVLGPDGSGWGVEVHEKDTFASIKTQHGGGTAVLDEADRFVTKVGHSIHVVVRKKLGERTFTCDDYRIITERPLADSYVEACSALQAQ